MSGLALAVSSGTKRYIKRNMPGFVERCQNSVLEELTEKPCSWPDFRGGKCQA